MFNLCVYLCRNLSLQIWLVYEMKWVGRQIYVEYEREWERKKYQNENWLALRWTGCAALHCIHWRWTLDHHHHHHQMKRKNRNAKKTKSMRVRKRKIEIQFIFVIIWNGCFIICWLELNEMWVGKIQYFCWKKNNNNERNRKTNIWAKIRIVL